MQAQGERIIGLDRYVGYANLIGMIDEKFVVPGFIERNNTFVRLFNGQGRKE